MLSDGTAAPDFILPGSDGTDLREYMLADVTREGPVVLAFYPFDFYPAAVEQLQALRDRLETEWRDDVAAIAVSRDSAFSHHAFAREYDLPFPLLADSDGHVSDTYGVLAGEMEAHGGVSRPAVFVIDATTTVRYAWAGDAPDEQPDWDAVGAAVERA